MFTKTAPLSVQVCVPKDYTDEQVTSFANRAAASGTEQGWQIRREGDPLLRGDPERVPCHKYGGCVHIVLDC